MVIFRTKIHAALLSILLTTSGSIVWAEDQICSLPNPCNTYRGGLLSVEIPKDQIQNLLNGSIEFTTQLSPSRCWFTSQEVQLHNLDSKGYPMYWGRAKLNRLTATPNSPSVRGQFGVLELTLSNSVLATECFGYCDVINQLPSFSTDVSFIDLRPRDRSQKLPLPLTSINIPLEGNQASQRFDYSKLPLNKNQQIVLIHQSPKIEASEVLMLARQMRQRGWTRISWYYPGFLGLIGVDFPRSLPPRAQFVLASDVAKWPVNQTAVYYVGPKFKFRNLNLGPHKIQNASYLGLTTGLPNNPFESRTFIGNFGFPKRMPIGQRIVLVDADTTETFQIQAAEALMRNGQSSISILAGGLYGVDTFLKGGQP